MGLLGTLIWCAVLLFGVVTARQVAFAWLANRASLEVSRSATSAAINANVKVVAEIDAQRHIAVARIQHAEPSRQPSGLVPIVIPDDLEAHLNTWSDEFARDDQRGYIKHLFREQDRGKPDETWQVVRRLVGIGELPG